MTTTKIYFKPKFARERGYWCEDADWEMAEALAKTGDTMDSKLPITWALDNMYLSQTLMLLGGAMPKHLGPAYEVVDAYCKYLHLQVVKAWRTLECQGDFPELIPRTAFICSMIRENAARRQQSLWRHAMWECVDPNGKLLCRANITLFNTMHPWNILAAHATKYALTAGKNLDLDYLSLQHLTGYLRSLLP